MLGLMTAEGWAEHARRALSESGHRSGGARTAVVDLLAEQHCCVSAQEIHDSLRERGRSAGLASIYRALDVLAQLRLVHRVDVDGIARYEPALPNGEHHHHAVCDSCGRRDAFADAGLEELIAAVGGRLGYVVGAHDVVLRGRCPRCAER